MDYEKLRDGYLPNCGEDKFEFKKLAETIPAILKDYKKPITIGIYGKIGSGKSALLKMIEETLGKSIIRFEAWKHQDSKTIWRTFLYEISKGLPSEQSESINDAINNLSVQEEYFDISVWSRNAIGVTFAILVLIGFFGVLSLTTDRQFFDFATLFTSLGGMMLAMLKFLSPKRIISPLIALDKFEEIYLKNIPNTGTETLYVAVENLDRCDPKDALELLKKLHAFFYAEETNHKPNVVFFILCDPTVLRDEISKIYSDQISIEEYLSKIVEIPIYVPKPSSNIPFIRSLTGITDENDSSFSSGAAKMFREMGIDNPREIKRLIKKWLVRRQLLEKTIGEDKKIFDLFLLFIILEEEMYEKYYSFWETAFLLHGRSQELANNMLEKCIRAKSVGFIARYYQHIISIPEQTKEALDEKFRHLILKSRKGTDFENINFLLSHLGLRSMKDPETENFSSFYLPIQTELDLFRKFFVEQNGISSSEYFDESNQKLLYKDIKHYLNQSQISFGVKVSVSPEEIKLSVGSVTASVDTTASTE